LHRANSWDRARLRFRSVGADYSSGVHDGGAGFGFALPHFKLESGLAEVFAQTWRVMEKFKIAMGFPMLATAFWLLA